MGEEQAKAIIELAEWQAQGKTYVPTTLNPKQPSKYNHFILFPIGSSLALLATKSIPQQAFFYSLCNLNSKTEFVGNFIQKVNKSGPWISGRSETFRREYF